MALKITIFNPQAKCTAGETAFFPDGALWYRIGDLVPCEWIRIWEDRALRRDEWEMMAAVRAEEAARPLLAGLGLGPFAVPWSLIYLGLGLLALTAIISSGKRAPARTG